MRLRLLLAFGVVLLCSAFQSTGFSGCGGSAPPPADLPPSEEMGCFTDAECVGDPCRTYACVTGICMDRGILDNDLDGVAGGSCGADCDDFDRSRYPGAIESCDGIDQDCDGEVDEDAIPDTATWSLFSEDGFPSMTVLDDGLVVGQRSRDPAGMQLVLIDRFGGVSTSHAVLDDASILEHRLVTRVGGATLIAATDAGEIRMVRVTAAEVSNEQTILGEASHLNAITYGDDELAVVWVDAVGHLALWTVGFASPDAVDLGPVAIVGNEPIDIAWDGTSLVVGSPPSGLVFVNPTGTTTPETRDLGDRTLAFGPLASGDGEVIALLRDAFDHTITGLTMTSPIGRAPAPSVRDTTMPGRVDTLGDRIVVTRFSDGSSSISGTTISLLDASFIPLATVDPSMTGSFGGPASSWDVALHPDFTTVVTAFDGNLFGVTLGCGL